MKKIGIIFAMYEELEAFLKLVKQNKTTKIYDLTFYECTVNNCLCILTETGVGKVNASRSTQVLIDKYSPDYIFNIGVAGGITKELNVSDVVVANSLIQYDFDITAFNHPIGYVPKVGVYVECDNKLINLALSLNKNNIKKGIIATADSFCTNESKAKDIHHQFNAIAVEMEGASVGQVCYLCNIPFLVIRAISDVIGKDNLITYEKFLNESSREVSNTILEIIKKL